MSAILAAGNFSSCVTTKVIYKRPFLEKSLIRNARSLNLELLHNSHANQAHFFLGHPVDVGSGGGGNSTYYVMGTCHFARKIGTHNSVNSGGF